MYSKQATIKNASGFHIRPAQLFTEKATSFESTIKINESADGKSILGLMTLGLGQGSVITISAEGPDEEAAVEALVELVESGFGEA